jgi:hypothetical protein
MEQFKTLNEKLVDALHGLNAQERTVKDAQAGMQRTVQQALQLQKVVDGFATNNMEKINERRTKLGSLFGKSEEEVAQEAMDLEALLLPLST